MALRISRKSRCKSASRCRTTVKRAIGNAADAKIIRMAQAMISSSKVMPD
jgi:hypothetical protein